MKIGVISDTHDNLIGLREAIRIFKENKIEMLVHCGDWASPFVLEFFDKEMDGYTIPIKSVVGNNSGDIKRTIMGNQTKRNPIEWPRTVTLKFEVDNKKMIIYHGDDPDLLEALIDCQKYDVVFTGHTHLLRNEVIGKTFILNPGSLSREHKGEITERMSVAIYNSETNTAEIIEF
jgi:putative phosphoesterase